MLLFDSLKENSNGSVPQDNILIIPDEHRRKPLSLNVYHYLYERQNPKHDFH